MGVYLTVRCSWVAMQTVTVPALVNFTYKHRTFSVGDDVTVAPVEAAVLSREGKVSIVAGTVVAKPEPEPPRRRRSYRRRDLVAES